MQQQRLAALMFIDLDNFKTVNDSFGHDYGDEVLQLVSTRMQQVLRAEDLFVRSGGEEFVLLLPRIDEAGLLQIAEQIRAAVEALPAEPVGMTVSLGTTLVQPEEDINQALARADEWLYRAKRAGRNRVAHCPAG